MPNVSIERALPYIDDLEEFQKTSTLALNGLVRRLQSEGQSYTTTLLVDDVTNPVEGSFNLDAYEVSSRADKSTLVMRESELQAVASEFYDCLSQSLATEELAKFKTLKGFTGSFYIAVWTLVRLGRIRHPDFPEERISDHIINVLPETWLDGEKESLDIIRKSPYADATELVEYFWFKSAAVENL